MWQWKRIKKGDYYYGLCKEHPFATKNGYVLEHRLVAENHLGRTLSKNEVVHHKDGNRYNNSWKNLEVMTRDGHSQRHATLKKEECRIKVVCSFCGKTFLERGGMYKYKVRIGRKEFFCSRSCSAKFHRSTSFKPNRELKKLRYLKG